MAYKRWLLATYKSWDDPPSASHRFQPVGGGVFFRWPPVVPAALKTIDVEVPVWP